MSDLLLGKLKDLASEFRSNGTEGCYEPVGYINRIWEERGTTWNKAAGALEQVIRDEEGRGSD